MKPTHVEVLFTDVDTGQTTGRMSTVCKTPQQLKDFLQQAEDMKSDKENLTMTTEQTV